MNLSRLKFKDHNIKRLFDDYETISKNPVTYFGQNYKERCEIIQEVEQRLLDKDKEILRLRREADKAGTRRMGEIR